MTSSSYKDHYDAAEAFFAEARERDPEKYEEVCKRHPVIRPRHWRTIKGREITVGLLGLSASAISPEVANKYGMESVYETKDEDG